MPSEYRTSDLARAAGVHLNTVRFYERIGILSPVPRRSNGYRVFSERHLLQLLVARCIYRHGWLGKEVRRASLAVVRAVRDWDLARASAQVAAYVERIELDLAAATSATEVLERWLHESPSVGLEPSSSASSVAGPEPSPSESSTITPSPPVSVHPGTGASLSHRDAAACLGVTEELLRNWERNGLFAVSRVGPNRARVYSRTDMERLQIIHLLRQGGYSLSAIRSSLRELDGGNRNGVTQALNEPEPLHDAAWTCVGDRLVRSLQEAREGAREIMALIEEAATAQLRDDPVPDRHQASPSRSL